MLVAIAIVGGLALLFSFVTVFVSWVVAMREGKSVLSLFAVIVTVCFFLSITLFVLALMMETVVAIAIVGGLALLGNLWGLVVCWAEAIDVDRDERFLYWFAAISTVGFLLTIALLVLALVK